MIEILAGPPYNKPFAEIGRMNRQQAHVLIRHRDEGGKLDHDMLRQAQRDREGDGEAVNDAMGELRMIRRLQGWPEYLIDRAVKMLEAMNA